jgi:hypothetical protein
MVLCRRNRPQTTNDPGDRNSLKDNNTGWLGAWLITGPCHPVSVFPSDRRVLALGTLKRDT